MDSEKLMAHPPYTAGTDYICIISEVRRLARNVLTADFTDEQIESYAYKAYSIIRTLTNKDDWDDSDREFGAMQGFNTDIAADWIKSHFGKTDEDRGYAKSRMEATIEALKVIIEDLDTDTGETDLLIAKTPRRGWNINPDVPVPRGNLTIS